MFVAGKLTDYLILHERIPCSEREIFRYGFELLISVMGTFITIMLSSVFLFERLDGIVFTLFFFAIRIFSGGGHADKFYKCYIYTNLLFITVAFCARFLCFNNLAAALIILLFCYYYIYKLSLKTNDDCTEKTKVNRRNLKRMMVLNIVQMLVIFIISGHYFSMAVYTTVMLFINQVTMDYSGQRRKDRC